jgi:pimeloyl-ACP methyl ester carboxylesterase
VLPDNIEQFKQFIDIFGIEGIQVDSGTLAFSAAEFKVIEDGTSVAAVTVTRSSVFEGEPSATITLSNGTATAPEDYSNTAVEVKFAPGETQKTVFIPIVDDSLVEGNETINLTLGAPKNGATIGTPNTAVLQVLDNDGSAVLSATPGNLLSADTMDVFLPPGGELSLDITITVPGDGSAPQVVDVSPSARRLSKELPQAATPASNPAVAGVSLNTPQPLPLDVFLLQDLSGSFDDDLVTLRGLVPNLVSELKTRQPDTTFGFGSFIDKPVEPFGISDDYVYFLNQAQTTDATGLQSTVNNLTVRGASGLDAPEAQLEALLQVARRTVGSNENGFRSGARHVVIVSTDNAYHEAGDGAEAGITAPNDGDAVIEPGEDYPSVTQVRDALIEADIVPVFAVTQDKIGTYNDLVNQLGFGKVVRLESNSSNLTSAITEGLGAVGSEINIFALSDEFGYVKDILPRNFQGVLAGQKLTFTVKLKNDGAGGDDTLTLRALGYGDTKVRIVTSEPGSSTDTASSLGELKGRRLSGYLNTSDISDYYKFTLKSRKDFKLFLESPIPIADPSGVVLARLRDRNGEILQEDTPPAVASADISRRYIVNTSLEAGDYYLEIYRNPNAVTDLNLFYDLRVSAAPPPKITATFPNNPLSQPDTDLKNNANTFAAKIAGFGAGTGAATGAGIGALASLFFGPISVGVVATLGGVLGGLGGGLYASGKLGEGVSNLPYGVLPSTPGEYLAVSQNPTQRSVSLQDIEPFPPIDPEQTWVIIHGWNDKSETFKGLAEALKKIKPNDRVLLLDWRQAAANGKYDMGKDSDIDASLRMGNYFAAKWIKPVAQFAVDTLEAFGIDAEKALSSLNLIGHSLGSLVSAEIGNLYKGKQKGAKAEGVRTITALDPPSSFNIGLLDSRSDYDVDGRNTQPDIPAPFNEVSKLSRALVGKNSLAGNQNFAAGAHESFQMDFGSIIDLGDEHNRVVQAFTELLKQKDGEITNQIFNQGTFDARANAYTYDSEDAKRGLAHEGVLKVNASNNPIELVVKNSKTSGENDLILYGTPGNDSLSGGTGNDSIQGYAANDSLYGDSGNDTLLGGKGNDTLSGGFGNDNILGQKGNDSLSGYDGNDYLDGGEGNDTLIGITQDFNPIRLELRGLREIDTLIGGEGSDIFILGDAKSHFYDAGDGQQTGTGDYALIVGFGTFGGQDIIQLNGSRDKYVLGNSPSVLPAGTGIYVDTNQNKQFDNTDELIAIVQTQVGPPPLTVNLDGSYFKYV